MRSGPSAACLTIALLLSACGSRSEHHDDSVLGHVSSGLTVPAGCPTINMDAEAPDPTAIALTFDDGPEYSGTTNQVLDILATERVHATFFINTNDAIDVLATPSARLVVQRMVADGHEVGNHTVHHYSLADASTDVVSELAGVVSVLKSVAPGALANRLVRAPFGEPYFGPQATLDTVAPIVTRYGVHIGWNIDSRDWSCASSDADAPACIKKNVLDLVDAGHSGIVLLHSTQAATVTVLPDLIAALRTRGKKFIGVEELVVAKYGKPSRRLFRCASTSDCYGGDVCGGDNHCGPSTTTTDAGVTDSGPKDSGPTDTGVKDSGVAPDTTIADSATLDTAVADSAAFAPDTFAPLAEAGGGFRIAPNLPDIDPLQPVPAGAAPDEPASVPDGPIVGSACAHGRSAEATTTGAIVIAALVALTRRRGGALYAGTPRRRRGVG